MAERIIHALDSSPQQRRLPSFERIAALSALQTATIKRAIRLLTLMLGSSLLRERHELEAQIRHEQRRLIAHNQLNKMSQFSNDILSEQYDRPKLFIDTENLKQVFSRILNPQRLPSDRTEDGLVYRVIPPPGIDGPDRVSMLRTGIWASRLLLVADQSHGVISPESTVSRGILCYDGKCPCVTKNSSSKEDDPDRSHVMSSQTIQCPTSADQKAFQRSNCVVINPSINNALPIGSVNGLTATRQCPAAMVSKNDSSLDIRREASINDQRLKQPTKPVKDSQQPAAKAIRCRLLSATAPAPIYVSVTPENVNFLSPSTDQEILLARAKFAVEVARQNLHLTPKQMLSMIAVPVPALGKHNEKDTHTIETRPAEKTYQQSVAQPVRLLAHRKQTLIPLKQKDLKQSKFFNNYLATAHLSSGLRESND